jgi:hypothetical protein
MSVWADRLRAVFCLDVPPDAVGENPHMCASGVMERQTSSPKKSTSARRSNWWCRAVGSQEPGLRDSLLRPWVGLAGAGKGGAPSRRRRRCRRTRARRSPRLRRENHWVRMERDILKRRSRSLPEPGHEPQLHRGSPRWLSGAAKAAFRG